ncbi:MAG: response regulator [Alphaproteobacteria bacterium]|nr:response regulator [Alphaproteobacteria bacterium]
MFSQLWRPRGDWLGRAIIALAAALYLVFATTAVLELFVRRHDAIDEATRRAEGLNYLLLEHLRSTVVSIDGALKQLAAHSRRVGGPEAGKEQWSPILSSVLASLSGVGSLSVVSADGVVRYATSPGLAGLSHADDRLIESLRDGRGTSLVAGAPRRSHVSGHLVLPLGLRLETEQGVFAGAVVATLDPELLRAIYQAVEVGPNGAILIADSGGTVLLRHPPDSAAVPAQLTEGALAEAMTHGGFSGVVKGPLAKGGSERLTVYRMLNQPRLLVGVSLSAADVSDEFNRDALVRVVALALMGLAVFYGGRALAREAGSRARSERAIAQRERHLMEAQRIADMASLRFSGPDLGAAVSDRARAFFAWPAARATVTADAIADLVVDIDAEAFRREIDTCREAHRGFALDLRTGDVQNPARLLHVEGSWEEAGPDAPEGVLVVFHDVTRERRAESRLRHAERLEAVGRLTGGVAHDFNNMLTVILGNVDRLSDNTDAQVTREAVDEIGRAAERAAELTQQLLAFARRQPLRPQRIDINELVRAAAGMLGRVLGRQVELQLELSDAPCRTLIDAGQVETALVNLCANARDAMPSGGRLTIASSLVDLDAAYVRDQPDAVAGRHVMLSVSDTGVGIPAEQLPFVFEPFFSTKEVGQGTGLGLAMVYGFVKQSGGHVRIQSEPGKGTTIRLYLPEAVDSSLAAAESGKPGSEPSRGAGEAILLVEDEEMVRESLTRQLTDLGYEVVVTADGAAALAALAAQPRIALLLTDVILSSGLNGREIAERAGALRPDLPIVFMSGHEESVMAREGRLEPLLRVLSKPFRKQELADIVRRALDERRAASAP